jgi:hypothetical protein
MYLTPTEHQKAVNWIQQHWQDRCPFCGQKGVKWMVESWYELPSVWFSPSASQAKMVFSVIPVTCPSCAGTAFLQKNTVVP